MFFLNVFKLSVCLWKDHVTNMEVLSRTGQRRLQDIVAEWRHRMAGHIIKMPLGRPANHAMSRTPRGIVANDEAIQRRRGGPHFKRGPGGPRSRLERRPGCGYKQEQMANSCCPLSCQRPE